MPPEPRETFALTMDDGAIIRVRRHGNVAGPRLVISHGNGFAVDAYYPFWTLFLDRYDVVLFDLRNHGQNPRHQRSCHDLAHFVSDFECVWQGIEATLGRKPTAGIFHSISAITSIRHAVEAGWRWDALIAVDPPFVPSPGHALHGLAHGFELGLSKWARRRPQRFREPAELARILSRAGSCRRWLPGTQELMARSVLRQDSGQDDWALACPGEYESQIYAANAALDLCPRLAELAGPIKFIGADPQAEDAWSPAIVNRALHEEIGHPYTYIAETSHMIHLEKPVELAREVASFLGECGIG